MSDIQPPTATGYAPPPASLKPHRGTVVLVLGILGLVICFICGIVAWVMGNNDLREMEAGVMDPSGMGMTKAGKICGMISCILAIVAIGLWVLVILMGVIGAAAS